MSDTSGSEASMGGDVNMDSQSQISTIRYLKGNQAFKFFKDPLEETRSMFNYDLELIARDAMTFTAQRSTAKLPAELRLEVMKASVLYHKSTEEFEDLSKVDKLEAGAVHLFDGEHIKQSDKAVYDVLKEAADEAFLGNSIFKVSLDIFRAPVFTSNLPEPLLARIRYFHVRAYLSSNEWREEHLNFLTETWDRVKACPWNLKACVLTLEVRTCDDPGCRLGTHSFAVSTVDQTTQFSAELLEKTNAGLDLGTILATVFEDFADKLPASRCYVRIVQAHFDTTSAILTRSYGPLLAVQRAEHVGLDPVSHGERMLDQAYRFARTSELRRQDRSGRWE